MNFGQQEVEKIAPFMVIFCDLHYNVIQRGCEGISGENYIIARNCLTYMIVNMSKVRVGYLIDAYITLLPNHTKSQWRTFVERAISMISTICKDAEYVFGGGQYS